MALRSVAPWALWPSPLRASADAWIAPGLSPWAGLQDWPRCRGQDRRIHLRPRHFRPRPQLLCGSSPFPKHFAPWRRVRKIFSDQRLRGCLPAGLPGLQSLGGRSMAPTAAPEALLRASSVALGAPTAVHPAQAQTAAAARRVRTPTATGRQAGPAPRRVGRHRAKRRTAARTREPVRALRPRVPTANRIWTAARKAVAGARRSVAGRVARSCLRSTTHEACSAGS